MLTTHEREPKMADNQDVSSDDLHPFNSIALPSLAMEDNSDDEILFEPSFTEEDDEEDEEEEDDDEDDETEDEGLGEGV